MNALKPLLDPFTPQEFLRDYWDKQPLLINRSDRQRYESLFRFSEIDRILNLTNAHSEQVDLLGVKEPYTVPSSAYQAYHGGFSIRIRSIEDFVPELNLFVRDLSLALGFDFNINLYLTPPSSRGLDIHYDRHDVFVMQIAGSKHWTVYEPQYRWPNPSFQPKLDHKQDPPEVMFEAELHPGDLLYTPRGFPHHAVTKEDLSVHLTLGFTPYTWRHLMGDMVQVLGEQVEAVRKLVPTGSLTSGELTGMVQRTLADMIRLLDEPLIAEAALQRSAKSFIRSRKPLLEENQLELVARLNSVDTRTPLKRCSPCLVTSFKMIATINFPGGKLDAPRHIEPIFEYIAGTPRFTAGDLPAIVDDESRLLLVRTLITKGLLTVARDA